jgi:outer membrane protein, heavy metal efflux system
MNVGQADRPDHLESEIEAERAELDFADAQNDLEQTWRLLASIAGAPDMKLAPLAGDLEAGPAGLDQQALMATLASESPEIKRACARPLFARRHRLQQ